MLRGQLCQAQTQPQHVEYLQVRFLHSALDAHGAVYDAVIVQHLLACHTQLLVRLYMSHLGVEPGEAYRLVSRQQRDAQHVWHCMRRVTQRPKMQLLGLAPHSKLIKLVVKQ